MFRNTTPLTWPRLVRVMIGLLCLLLICMLLGIAFGASPIPFTHILIVSDTSVVERAILQDIRLPRVVIAALRRPGRCRRSVPGTVAQPAG